MRNSVLRNVYEISRWPLAFAGLALAAFFLLVWSPLLAQTTEFKLEQALTSGTTFAPGDRVGIRATVEIPASETLDSNAFRIEVVGVQTYVFNVALDPGNVSFHQSGASLTGAVSHTGDLTKVGSTWEAATASDDYKIEFAGNFLLPEDAFPGTYTLRTRVAGVDSIPAAVNTFRVEDFDGVFDPTPSPGEPSGRSPVIRMQPRNHVEIPSGIISTLNSQVRAAVGSSNVTMLAGNAPLRSNESGSLVLELTGLNMPVGQSVSGPININAPQIEMTTENGSGTATLQLGPGMVLTGDVEISVRSVALHVVFSNARITFAPTAPNAELITGGQSSVTHLNAAFDVGITELPQGSAIELVFAKAASEFISNPSNVFGDAAEELGGALESASTDIAFTVEATRDGISNDHLGSNVASLSVSNAWYEARENEGKEFAILKTVNGGSHVEEASCSSGANATMVCTAEFSGDAGGFSTFSLFAVGEPEVAPTPTPTPTATPTPTPTVAPTVVPPGVEGDGNLWIIILVVAVVLAGGGAAFFFLRRRPAAEA